MNIIINRSKSAMIVAFATVSVVVGTAVVLPSAAAAYQYGSTSSSGCCSSSSSYGSSASSYTPSYGSSASSYTPSYGSSASSYKPSYGTSASSYTPSYGSSASSYTPSYGSSASSYTSSGTAYYTPSTSGTAYYTPTYTTSSYTTPSYMYSAPSYTSSSYTTPTYTYTTPTYTYTPPTYNTNTPPTTVIYQPVCQIYANPTQVAYNGSVTLTWSSNYATSASLSGVGTVAVSGSRVVNNITSNQTYTLTVTGQGGTNTCMTYVYVQQPQTPACQIYASPSSVQAGGSTTLTWTSTNATSASLSEVGSVATNGSYIFNGLYTTKTYTLTVTGQGGTNTCTASVGVYDYQQQTPACTLTVNPSYLNQNGSTVLSWTTTNASSASIDGIGNVMVGSGSQTVYPGYSRTYTMTVYGTNGQTRTCSGYVTVQNQTTNTLYCSITANPSTLQNGAGSVLSWTSTGAVSAMLSDGLGNMNTNGSLTVYPEANRNYVLTVRDANGQTQTCSTNVYVNGSYISLTQIPYTGFDFGPIGNTLYWMVLAGGAAAAAYLMTMYRGGVLGLAFAGVRKEAAIAKAVITEEEKEITTPVESEEEIETTAGDAMTLQMVGGIPRLVINRSQGTEGLPGQK